MLEKNGLGQRWPEVLEQKREEVSGQKGTKEPR